MSPAEEVPQNLVDSSGGAARVPDEIRLSLPASAEYSSVVTLTAAAIAKRHGFGPGAISRLQDRASEVFAVAIGPSVGTRSGGAATETTVVFRVAGPAITVAVISGAAQLDVTIDREG